MSLPIATSRAAPVAERIVIAWNAISTRLNPALHA
jgi:hypothetical protein